MAPTYVDSRLWETTALATDWIGVCRGSLAISAPATADANDYIRLELSVKAYKLISVKILQNKLKQVYVVYLFLNRLTPGRQTSHSLVGNPARRFKRCTIPGLAVTICCTTHKVYMA